MSDTQRPALLRGGAAIAEYLGFSEKATRHLIAQRRIPTFKIGATIVARVATLDAWLEEQERAALGEPVDA